MNLEIISEPELQFGDGNRHIDTRFGLMLYKPFDYNDSRSPKDIKLGVVGTNETIDGISTWFDKCQKGIQAKESHQPNLFPPFPGYGGDSNLPAPLVLSSQNCRSIQQSVLKKLIDIESRNKCIEEAVKVFTDEIIYLSQNSSASIIICALPDFLLDHMEEEQPENKLDFRDFLKASVMSSNIHTQLIRPSTYDESKKKKQKKRPTKDSTKQDEATRAWNFYTALYYKAKGTPWRLIRDSSELTTCYIGVSFYRSVDGDKVQTSIAQVFNERGEGVIVRGGIANISKDDRQPHLSTEHAYQLLNSALETYRKEHGTLPARLVLHKSSNYNDDELNGFRQALNDQRVSFFDLTTVLDTRFRLFREKQYPPLRGTFLSLDSKKHILYTKGSVDFFSTYPGMYVPSPLEIRCFETEQTPKYLAQEIMALSKMNWNNTQFDGSQPITLWASRQVGKVLKYIQDGGSVQPRYSFYM